MARKFTRTMPRGAPRLDLAQMLAIALSLAIAAFSVYVLGRAVSAVSLVLCVRQSRRPAPTKLRRRRF
jgi:hypothetical protein